MTSFDRFATAVNKAYAEGTPRLTVTEQEWKTQVEPALEAQRDLTTKVVDTINWLATHPAMDRGAQEAAKKWVRDEAKDFFPGATPGPQTTIAINPSGRHEVYLAADGSFTINKDGSAPADLKTMGSSLYRAAKFVEDNFGEKNLFTTPGITIETKQKVFEQLNAALAKDFSSLDKMQMRQVTASAGALLVELFKSIPEGPQATGLRRQIFDRIAELARSTSTPPVTRAIITARLQDKEVTGSLSAAQKVVNAELLEYISPKDPLPYADMARQAARDGEARLNIVHTCGPGEGFLYGYAKSLVNDGFVAEAGVRKNGPGKYTKTIPANDPKNQWGVPFKVTIELRDLRGGNIYSPMSDPNVQWVSYGGHSNLGRNKLESLENAPEAKGFKLIMTDLCCGSDGMDAEWERYPGVQNLTSHSSTYFRTTTDEEYGKYTYASEGYDMMMVMIGGAVAKKAWSKLDTELDGEANWHRRDAGNNWITPHAWRRAFRELDGDNDGISDLMDALASFDSFNVEEDTRREFELSIPQVAADEIDGRRAFLATRAINTLTNYNPSLQYVNSDRDITGGPDDIFFPATPGEKSYVKFTKQSTPDGDEVFGVQFSSALADASVETLRAILAYEYVRHLTSIGRLKLSGAESMLMGLVFAASSLEYDRAYRDREIFDGLRALYGIPDSVTHSEVAAALSKADSVRHNHTGDPQAVSSLRETYEKSGVYAELSKPGVGSPSRPVGAAVG